MCHRTTGARATAWAGWSALLLAACAAPARDGARAPAARATPSVQLFLENDLLFGHDDEYTSGAGARWTSAEVPRGEGGLSRCVDAFDGLPTFGDPERARFVTLTVGQEMYTPQDIQAPAPPPGEHPYAGVLFLDAGLHSLGATSLHSYTLRVGVVGPSSGAEQVQRAVHELLGIPIAQGWDTQLDDEPLLNLDYRYQRRLLRLGDAAAWSHDLAWNSGAGVGNYYVGGDMGLVARLGLRVPATFGVPELRGGDGALAGLAAGPHTRWWGYLFGGARAHGVARFLPSDGNSGDPWPEVDRDEVFGSLTAGLVLGYGRLQVVYTIHDLGGLDQRRDQGSADYGSLTLSWSL